MSLRVLGGCAVRFVAGARSMSMMGRNFIDLWHKMINHDAYRIPRLMDMIKNPQMRDIKDLVQEKHNDFKEKEIIEWYLRKTDPNEAVDVWENTALHVVENPVIARCLLKAKANPNAMNGMGRTVLEEQVKRGNLDVVMELIGGKVDLKQGKPIFDAVKNDDVDMVSELAEWDADMQVRDGSGATPLHYARHWEIACILLNCGVDVNGKDKAGNTALLNCMKRYEYTEDFNDLLFLLLVRGANPNSADALGRTPLFYTVQGPFCFHREAARKLLQYGAGAEHKDPSGKIALYHAAELGNREAVAFFLNWREKKVMISAIAPQDELTPCRRFRKMGQSS